MTRDVRVRTLRKCGRNYVALLNRDPLHTFPDQPDALSAEEEARS